MSPNHCVFREPSLVLLQIISYVKDPYVGLWAWAYCESWIFIYFSPEHSFSAEVILPPKWQIVMSGDEKSLCMYKAQKYMKYINKCNHIKISCWR